MTWLSSLFSSWLVNPLLFAGGALLVSVPIVIHLLNRRRVQVVDWAAMEFLLEAEQQNRRRIQLESLLLLLLRCLAVLLIVLLLSRPFLQQTTGTWMNTTRFERIVILNDSPSMAARHGQETSFSQAITLLSEWVEELSSEASDDTLTVLLTSSPSRPWLVNEPINSNTAVEIVQQLKQLEPTDRSARLDLACDWVERELDDRSDRVNRVLYVVSDLREHDWRESAAEESAAAAALKKVSGKVAGCFLMDVGSQRTENLGIVSVVPRDKALLAGLPIRYEVVVRNYGTVPARQVPVQFAAGDSLPLKAEIDLIPAGGTAAIPFTHTIMQENAGEQTAHPLRIEVAIDPTSPHANDVLSADDSRFFAARVAHGIDTLIVDGDAVAEFGQSESFYLARALAPPGDLPSGMAVHTITDVDFETEDLAKYQTIFLCNVFRLSAQRQESLERWVTQGGGLVVMPGGQVDDRYYAEELFRAGEGLLPLELRSIAGDEDKDTWVSFALTAEDHPVFAIFDGGASPVLETAKVFHWWKAVPSRTAVRAGQVNVLARLTDAEQSPAMVEMPKGEGRVVMTTFPADTAWSNWPEEAGYLVTLQELTRYMARRAANAGELRVGEVLQQPIDLSLYSDQVTLEEPSGTIVSIQPVAGEGARESQLVAAYSQTERRGFYEMTLNRVDGQRENVLFAANIENAEGQLARVDETQLTSMLGEQVQLVEATPLHRLDPASARVELWKWVLAAVVLVLCAEQILAWGFAARR